MLRLDPGSRCDRFFGPGDQASGAQSDAHMPELPDQTATLGFNTQLLSTCTPVSETPVAPNVWKASLATVKPLKA